MSVFVDANILLISVQPSHAMHEPAVRHVASLIQSGESLVVTPQIVAEFWNGAPRPSDRNGLGFSHDRAREELVRLEAFFTILSESPEVYGEWKRLVIDYQVTGVQVHDARLVAAMKVYGVRRILTFNAQDFRRYHNIVELIEPS
jgi:predicted nucleic acid-binding protein